MRRSPIVAIALAAATAVAIVIVVISTSGHRNTSPRATTRALAGVPRRLILGSPTGKYVLHELKAGSGVSYTLPPPFSANRFYTRSAWRGKLNGEGFTLWAGQQPEDGGALTGSGAVLMYVTATAVRHPPLIHATELETHINGMLWITAAKGRTLDFTEIPGNEPAGSGAYVANPTRARRYRLNLDAEPLRLAPVAG